ncbi:hypothetical protein LC609_31805, partial [Nostoc sp. XA013]|nr:hypothetical protein [Nostoc sp. XA013]
MAQKAATIEIPELMQFLRSSLHELPDERKPGNNTKYRVEDAVMAAFSVFFTHSELKARLAKWNKAGFDFRLEWLLRCINAVISGEAMFSALKDV